MNLKKRTYKNTKKLIRYKNTKKIVRYRKYTQKGGTVFSFIASGGLWVGKKSWSGIKTVGKGIGGGAMYIGKGISKGAMKLGGKVKHNVLKGTAKIGSVFKGKGAALKASLTPNFLIRRQAANKLTQKNKSEYFEQLIYTKPKNDQAYLKFLQDPKKNPLSDETKAFFKDKPDLIKSLKNENKNLGELTTKMNSDLKKISELPNSPLKNQKLAELISRREQLINKVQNPKFDGVVTKSDWKEIKTAMKLKKEKALITELEKSNPTATPDQLKSFAKSYLEKQKRLSKNTDLSYEQIKAKMDMMDSRKSHVSSGWYASKYVAQKNADMAKKVSTMSPGIQTEYNKLIKEGVHPSAALQQAKNLDTATRHTNQLQTGMLQHTPGDNATKYISPPSSVVSPTTLVKEPITPRPLEIVPGKTTALPSTTPSPSIASNLENGLSQGPSSEMQKMLKKRNDEIAKLNAQREAFGDMMTQQQYDQALLRINTLWGF